MYTKELYQLEHASKQYRIGKNLKIKLNYPILPKVCSWYATGKQLLKNKKNERCKSLKIVKSM